MVYDRYRLKPGDSFDGPAVFESGVDRRRAAGWLRASTMANLVVHLPGAV
jgi:hypothetical protein